MFSYQVDSKRGTIYQWHFISNVIIDPPFRASTQTKISLDTLTLTEMVSEELWEEWLEFVLVLCQAHSMALSFSVPWKRVTQKGVPRQGEHHFSPREWLFQPQSSRILCAYTACWTVLQEVAHIWSAAQHFLESQLFLRNKPTPSTSQMRKSNPFSSLVMNQEYSWSPCSLPLFSAYQLDMEIHTLQFFVNLKARIT